MSQDLDGELTRLGKLTDDWIRRAIEQNMSEPGRAFSGDARVPPGLARARPGGARGARAGGKKLRPGLALLVCQAVSGQIEPALPAAAGVELIHNFSLVHDDIQDRSALRRHRATLWSLWGAAQGINAGDALFALAQVVVLRGRERAGGADGRVS